MPQRKLLDDLDTRPVAGWLFHHRKSLFSASRLSAVSVLFAVFIVRSQILRPEVW